jgi:hypothetical protein
VIEYVGVYEVSMLTETFARIKHSGNEWMGKTPERKDHRFWNCLLVSGEGILASSLAV